MLIVILVILGVTVGVISSLFGVGGGFLIVPILFSYFSKAPVQFATATSLGVISLNSLLNTYNFTKFGKKIPWKITIFMAFGIILGILFGGQITFLIPSHILKKTFGTILFLAALKTLFLKIPKGSNQNLRLRGFAAAFLTTFLSGILSALTGLGGGVIMVPLFLFVLKIPFRDVSFFSNLMMAAGASIGVLSFSLTPPLSAIETNVDLASFQMGYVNWGIVLLIFIGSTLGSRLGVKWGQRIPQKWSKRIFALLLFTISLKILTLE